MLEGKHTRVRRAQESEGSPRPLKSLGSEAEVLQVRSRQARQPRHYQVEDFLFCPGHSSLGVGGSRPKFLSRDFLSQAHGALTASALGQGLRLCDLMK